MNGLPVTQAVEIIHGAARPKEEFKIFKIADDRRQDLEIVGSAARFLAAFEYSTKISGNQKNSPNEPDAVPSTRSGF